jgi:DNA polymerase-1
MKAAAKIEDNGIPIDIATLAALRLNWQAIRREVIEKVNHQYGVFDGTTFKASLFQKWLELNGIDWPQLPSGRLKLDHKTFGDQSKKDPRIVPIHEARKTLSQMRLEDLAVGRDGRNRTVQWAFSTKTGRNAPSNTQFVFGTAAFLRGLVQPGRGFGLAYIDWGQQEFGIAAALSRDARMIEAYQSGDPYIAFAKQAGAIPADATKQAHGNARELYKQCALGVLYGMGAASLAKRIGQPETIARSLLRLHHETYPHFWRWSDAALDVSMRDRRIWTVFGWQYHVGRDYNPRMLRNFPMQANGAEMLRLACCLATERGIRICAPVHDAILIEAPLEELDRAIDDMRRAMDEASQLVLGGFRLRTDVKVIRYPDRFQGPRGEHMWQIVTEVINRLDIAGQGEGRVCLSAAR